ncbi:unnamed protein product [Microthlaspi erraticum]|uniref:Uncharacterized protein n=1 Tax=Microthlaspi erraticum TaxID=1685480 RepID=A0A6D2JK47_9BRAS|nr:unnamed protein product [Microthlaspi erraticum]
MLSKAKKGSHIRTRDNMGFEMKRLRFKCPPKNWELGRGLEMETAIRSTPLDFVSLDRACSCSIELCLELALPS